MGIRRCYYYLLALISKILMIKEDCLKDLCARSLEEGVKEVVLFKSLRCIC